MTALLAYADKWSVRPGERMHFMVSCEGAEHFDANIVRIAGARMGPHAPPLRETPVDTPAKGTYPARVQTIAAGSYGVVPASQPVDRLESFTILVHVWPTLPGDGAQALIGTWCEQTRRGFGLALDDNGAPELRIGAGVDHETRISTNVPLAPRQWYVVSAGYDATTRQGFVNQVPLDGPGHDFHAFSPARAEGPVAGFAASGEALLIAAWHADHPGDPSRVVAAGHFDGKIERPRLANRALRAADLERFAADGLSEGLGDHVVASWDFGQRIPTTQIVDTGPHQLDGKLVNLPTRAMVGANWSGDTFDWREAPGQYGAIHFHRDDLYDCAWQPDFEFTVPADLASGVYAARLDAGDAQYHVSFFVLPAPHARKNSVAFLASTATYLAYANSITLNHDPLNEAVNGALSSVDAIDLMQWARPELGLSTYDQHRDGSGVCYSSRLRPIINFRPTGRLWNFGIDLFVIDWLERTGIGFDVITDDDLHAEGETLLEDYRVVITGCHPEYYSLVMLDALESWLGRGGRLMYLGGNGFYWRTSPHSELPGVIEVRRAEGGVRTWAAEPGEYHHSFTGEPGGLWQRQRRAPNRIAGVGFISQGFDSGAPYRRQSAANDPRVAFMFEGIDDQVLGNFGICLGGAASMEIDCTDSRLGTPAHALVVARSEGHSNMYELTPEAMLQSHPMTDATQNPNVRADMVFFETPNGGAVFSTGSIGYAGSLVTNDYQNNIARLTTNVLERFADPAPFEMPAT